ncbi:MAG: 3-deoxy-manno-octulosonate cytidylyltransferase [Ignavibacteria bacterium]|nr:3-deoxy-manno-octulosonate cytidylyltransferase [Ignavibacteria bacterium]
MYKNPEKIICVIPARFGSKRFPGKPLVKIIEKPMIQWVYDNVKKSKLIDDIYIATDDKRIYNTVEGFGGNVIMTSKHHKSGTDRIGEAIKNLKADIIVNIQGDEPVLSAKDVDKTIKLLLEDKNVQVATLVTKPTNIKDLFNKNRVKVVFDKNFNALYFSRSIIPFNETTLAKFNTTKQHKEIIHLKNYYLHIGIYVYRKDFLIKFINMKQSRLEKLEKLEQLRILENGGKIKIAISKNGSYSIDTKEDLKLLLKKLNT